MSGLYDILYKTEVILKLVFIIPEIFLRIKNVDGRSL